MDIVGFSIWLTILAGLMAAVVAYAWDMSKDLNIFDRMGVPGPPPFPILGNFGLRYWMNGVIKFQKDLYEQFKDAKVYGVFEANVPVLHVKDCDMIEDILVNYFDHFVDHPNRFQGDGFVDKCLYFLQGEQWRRSRHFFTSSINTDVIKVAASVIQRTCDGLVTFLKPKIDWRRRVELSELAVYYSIDVQTGIVFGGDYKTFEKFDGKNAVLTQKLLSKSRLWRLTSTFSPFMSRVWRILRVSLVPKRALRHCSKRVEEALQKAKKNTTTPNRRLWLLGLQAGTSAYSCESNGNNTVWRGSTDCNFNGKLSKCEIQAHAFTFIHAGVEKVSNVLSFTLLLLAHHADYCKIVQDEIDDHVGAKTPDEKNVQQLCYLDQCIRETMRLYPQSISIERVCRKDITIHGVPIPANMVVRIPVYALHNDAMFWLDPKKFRPERFMEDQNSGRHPGVYLPFGLGPRNCPGERLALLEVKMALVNILRVMTPYPVSHTVFPIKLDKWKMAAEDDLMVKFRPRYWSLEM